MNMKLSKPTTYRIFLAAILLVSLGLRLALTFQGGQFFNPDEYRYLYSRVAAHYFDERGPKPAVRELTRDAAHQGFKVLGFIPALVEVKRGENPIIPALFFGMFSWINIFLTWILARKLGSSEAEALIAAFLVATSNALFYYSNHIFPFDAAITFGMLALYAGLHGEFSAWRSVLTGMLSFAVFYTYNGYWMLAAYALFVHVIFSVQPFTRVLIKAVFAGLGFFASLFAVAWVASYFGHNLLRRYLVFSRSIKNGIFSDGGILPFAYLWETERIIFILWLALTVYAIFLLATDRSPRILIWVGAILFLYTSLAIPSVVLHKFVVYGRTIRLLVPFLVLASAFSLGKIQDNSLWGDTLVLIILLTVLVQAGANFRKVFLITYPADFALQAHERYPDFKPPRNMTYYYTPNMIKVGPYKAYYIKYISTIQLTIESIDGEILMSAEHPLSSFPPFRYEEAFTLEEKFAFPKAFSRMVLVRPNE